MSVPPLLPPQHFFSQLHDWAGVILTCFAVFCGHWAHQIYSDNKQSQRVFGQIVTSLMRSFWATRKCWKRKWAEMIKLPLMAARPENGVYAPAVGWRRLLRCQRVKCSRFLRLDQILNGSLFWTAFLIQLFTAVHWGGTSRDIQSIFRVWNEKFSLLALLFASWPDLKCQ